MKKLILFLILITTLGFAQPPTQPTEFKNGVKITGGNPTVTSVNFLTTTEANGVQGKITVVNLPFYKLFTFTTPEDFGAVGNGIADDKTAIQNAINSGKMVLLNGNYFTSGTITVNNKTNIYGNGKITINANAPILDIKANDVVIDGIRFEGNGRGTTTNYATTRPLQDAINVYGNVGLTVIWKNIKISNVSAYNMGGSLLNIENNGSGSIHTGGVNISNSVADLCWSGYTFRNRAEYSQLSNIKANNCEYGAYILSANNPITNPNFEDNRTGIYVGSSTNTGHSSVTGGSINHNIEKSIDLVGVDGGGYTFSNVQLVYGDISISGCDGIQLASCYINAPNFSVTTSTNTVVTSCRFLSAPTFTGLVNIIFQNTKWLSTIPPNFYETNENKLRIGKSTATQSAMLEINSDTNAGATISNELTTGTNRVGYLQVRTNTNLGSLNSYANTSASPINSLDGVYLMTRTAGMPLYITTNNAGTEGKRVVVNPSGGVGIGTLTDPGAGNILVNGNSSSASITITTSPTTSASGFEILTRNTTSGIAEKVASNYFPSDSDVIHKTGTEVITNAPKTFAVSSGTNAGLNAEVSGTATAGFTVSVLNNAVGQVVSGTSTNGTMLSIQNSGSSNGTMLNLQNNNTSTSKFIKGLNTAGTEIFTVSNLADVTANSYTKTGGTAQQFLLANGTTGIRPKLYSALITQSSTSAPTVVVLGDNTVGTIVWTRSTTGTYVGTLSGAFLVNKCQFFTNNTVSGSLTLQRTTDNTITLTTADLTGTLLDGRLTSNSIKIEVFP